MHTLYLEYYDAHGFYMGSGEVQCPGDTDVSIMHFLSEYDKTQFVGSYPFYIRAKTANGDPVLVEVQYGR